MAHKHPVYDTDPHFKIDGDTRVIINMSDVKVVLMQGDHNSERFTFEIPRYIDGHDMSLCNICQIHYLNVGSSTRATNPGVYEVEDLQFDPKDEQNRVVLSWLISSNVTMYVGSLSFVIRFGCSTDGIVDYIWNTAVHSGITISSSICNSETVVQDYTDILEQWRDKLFSTCKSIIDKTLTKSGQAADAKVTGDGITALKEEITDLDSRMLKSEEIVLFQRNLINVNNLIGSKYINNQGDLKDNTDYSVTDYEFVEPDTTYTFWRFGKNYKIGQNAFYTKDKKFISYLRDVKQWKSPSNAYYARMSMPTIYFTSGNPIVCKGTDYTGDTTYQNEYKTVVNHYVTREEIAKVNIPDMVESDTLSTLTINASNSKKNNLIGFEANFSTMGSVRIAHGTSYDANRSASIVVDATNIYLYDNSTNLRATYPHGLTMDKFITVSIVVGQMRTAKIILTTANGRFIQDSVFWVVAVKMLQHRLSVERSQMQD